MIGARVTTRAAGYSSSEYKRLDVGPHPTFHFLVSLVLMLRFATARKIKARIIGANAEKATSEGVIADLMAASVPISSADCRICPDPCDEGISVPAIRVSLSDA